MTRYFSIILILALLFTSSVFAGDHDMGTLSGSDFIWHSGRVDAHAPISVMGDHMHHSGEWMASYRAMSMAMSDYGQGSASVSEADVLAEYMMVPTRMEMSMQMLGLMSAPSDSLTLMVMLPYTRKTMSMKNRMGGTMEMLSEGMGDLKVTALMKIKEQGHRRVHYGFGLSLPTGMITKSNAAGQRLPYAMQLGSGTVDFQSSLTVMEQYEFWSWGLQIGTERRLGTNAQGYALGDKFYFSPWVSRMLSDSFSSSLRVYYETVKPIRGIDDEIPTMMSSTSIAPTAFTHNYGGQRIDLAWGLNFLGQTGRLKGHRFAFEYIIPVRQHVQGTQLLVESKGVLGWQYAW